MAAATAGTGYDGPTGLGTPNGTAAFTGRPAAVHRSPPERSGGTGTTWAPGVPTPSGDAGGPPAFR